MKKLSGFVFYSCCFLIFLLVPVLAAERPTLESVAFKKLDADREQVTFKLNGSYIPKTFAIKGKNPRVVFDFPKTTIARTMPNSIQTNGAYVKKIRIGLHTGDHPKTRVVLDLTDEQKIDFQQHFDPAANTLTILIFPLSKPPATGEIDSGKKPKQAVGKQKAEKKKKESAKADTSAGLSPAASSATDQHAKTSARTAPKSAATNTPSDIKRQDSVNKAGLEKTEAEAVPEQDTTTKKPQPTGSKPVVAKTADQPVAKDQETPVLQSVTFDNTTNRGEMIQFKLTDFHPPTVFGIEEGVPRVVCDFKNTKAGPSLKNIITANGRYVKTIRIGHHKNPDKIRVVIDLEANNNYDLQQVFFKEDDLFVIIVNTMHSAPTGETEKSDSRPGK